MTVDLPSFLSGSPRGQPPVRGHATHHVRLRLGERDAERPRAQRHRVAVPPRPFRAVRGLRERDGLVYLGVRLDAGQFVSGSSSTSGITSARSFASFSAAAAVLLRRLVRLVQTMSLGELVRRHDRSVIAWSSSRIAFVKNRSCSSRVAIASDRVAVCAGEVHCCCNLSVLDG